MAQDNKKYQKAILAGNHYNERQEWKKALGAFRVAMGEFPREPASYAGLGEACLGLNQLGRALECFKLASKHSRGEISYLEKVADIQERQGMLSEAGRTYLAVGEIYLKSRKLDEAVGSWQRAIRLESNLLGAHKRLAMVYQRQQNMRDAVRSYLAIARILQMRGQNKKALRMCQAALRLDPTNDDVLMAVELIRKGAEGYEEPKPDPEPVATMSPKEQEAADELSAAVRQIAAALETDGAERPLSATSSKDDPIAAAKQAAQEKLAEEIFRDEDDDEDATTSLSKLERDALIGQGMDLESRGKITDAIACYEKAIDGGLYLSAAQFILGMLYLDVGQPQMAENPFLAAAADPLFAKAIEMINKEP